MICSSKPCVQHVVAAGCSPWQGPPDLFHLLPTGQQQELGACLGSLQKPPNTTQCSCSSRSPHQIQMRGRVGELSQGAEWHRAEEHAPELGARAGLGQGTLCSVVSVGPPADRAQHAPVSQLGCATREELAIPMCRSCAGVRLSTNPSPCDEPWSETRHFYQC